MSRRAYVKHVKITGKGLVGGIVVVLAIALFYLLALCASILASAIIVDALWHLGRWLLGW